MNIQTNLGRDHGHLSAKLGIVVQAHLLEEHNIVIDGLDVGVGDFSEVIYRGRPVEVITGQQYHDGKLTGITLECKDITGLETPVVIQSCENMISLWDGVQRTYYLYELAGKPISELNDLLNLSNIT